MTTAWNMRILAAPAALRCRSNGRNMTTVCPTCNARHSANPSSAGCASARAARSKTPASWRGKGEGPTKTSVTNSSCHPSEAPTRGVNSCGEGVQPESAPMRARVRTRRQTQGWTAFVRPCTLNSPARSDTKDANNRKAVSLFVASGPRLPTSGLAAG